MPMPPGSREYGRLLVEVGRVGPVQLVLAEGLLRLQLQVPPIEQCSPQRSRGHRVQSAGTAEMHHRGTAVVADDPEVPEPVQQVGVVAVTGERLWVAPEHVRVEVRQDGELVVTADGGQHRPDRGIGEGSHQVPRPIRGGSAHLPGGRILHRHEAELILKPAHRHLMHVRERPGRGEGGRDDGHSVAGGQRRWRGQRRSHGRHCIAGNWRQTRVFRPAPAGRGLSLRQPRAYRGTGMRITRSSAATGSPRPSRLLVSSHSAPSGP